MIAPKLTTLGHPHEPLLAVSGIDHTIKIFSPDHQAQRSARLGINVNRGRDESSGSSSLNWGPRRRSRHMEDFASRLRLNVSDDEDVNDEVGDCAVSGAGLASRRRMHQSYEITNQNEVDRAGGNDDAFVAVSAGLFSLRRITMSFADWISLLGND